MSVQVSYKKQTLFFILLFFVLLGTVEISSRIYEQVVPNCVFLNSDATNHIDFNLKKSMCDQKTHLKTIDYPVNGYEPNQTLTTININSLGFRGNDFELVKDENIYRIFMIGGSTTFGTGATSDDATIPSFLQNEFKKNNYNVEIINAGVGGSNSFEEVYKIRHMYKQFDPDLFIIYDGYNDSRGVHVGTFDPNFSRDNRAESQRSIIHLFIRDNLQEYRTAYVFFPTMSIINNALKMNDEVYQKNSDVWSSRWDEMCKENTVDNIKTIILLQPIVGTGDKILSEGEKALANGIMETTMQKQLEYHAKTLPIVSCDGSIDLRNTLDGVSEPIYYDEGHMVDLGYELMAKEIYKKIIPIISEDLLN